MPELKNIVKRYGDTTVFDGLNIEFDALKTTCIMGASGIGKTTLLNIAAGLTEFEGERIGFNEPSYVFQEPRLLPHLTALRNIEYALYSVYPDKEKRRKVSEELAALCEISHVKNKLPRELSGGEGQRVSLARAFGYPSDLLIMDEPFSSLDFALKSRLMRLLTTLLQKSPKTVLYCTHDVYEALMLADSVVVLKKGGYEKIDITMPKSERKDSQNELGEIQSRIYKALEE